jgi:diguanylate cyclase (GGDEF)-like protein
MQKALEQLQQATHDHAEWQEKFLQAIDRGATRDRRAVGAHEGCSFDRRYYERIPAELWGQPAFAALGTEHERLHRLAAQLLQEMASDASTDDEYLRNLAAELARLRLRIQSLRQEIQGALRNRDELTGAEGRAGLLPELREWRELARRNVQPCCVVLMGLDRLAEINATHGQPAGDAVLADVVRCVSRYLRPYDKVFRYAGDEFLISLPGADLALGQTVIKRVREGLSDRAGVMTPGGAQIKATASFGLASLDADVAVEESIERAAQALVLAKTAGRNRAISWDPSVTTGTRLPRLRIEDMKA